MEVLVALTIMLIVLPLSVPIYESYTKDLQEQELREGLMEVRRALRIFYEDNHRFPYMIEDHFGNRVDVLDDRRSELVQGVHDGLGTYPVTPRRYLRKVPADPISGRIDWKLIPATSRSLIPTSRQALPTTTSTRQISAGRRGLTTGTVRLLDNISPIVRMQLVDLKSRTPGYESY